MSFTYQQHEDSIFFYNHGQCVLEAHLKSSTNPFERIYEFYSPNTHSILPEMGTLIQKDKLFTHQQMNHGQLTFTLPLPRLISTIEEQYTKIQETKQFQSYVTELLRDLHMDDVQFKDGKVFCQVHEIGSPNISVEFSESKILDLYKNKCNSNVETFINSFTASAQFLKTVHQGFADAGVKIDIQPNGRVVCNANGALWNLSLDKLKALYQSCNSNPQELRACLSSAAQQQISAMKNTRTLTSQISMSM